MVDDSTSEDLSTTNKGVNVHSESLPAAVHQYQESDSSYSKPRSVTQIKNEIQTVLDLMGTSTPRISHGSDADNEDSHSSVVIPRSRHTSMSSRRGRYTDKPTAVSKSVETQATSARNSLVADMGSFEDYDRSCCDHTRFILPPECLCAQHVTPTHSKICYSTPKSAPVKRRSVIHWLKEKSSELKMKKPRSVPCDLYKINICGQVDDLGAPKRVVFDLVEGIPKPVSTTVATNTIRNPIEKCKTNPEQMISMSKNEPITSRIQRNIFYDSDGNARVDFYYFDHGNAQYFHTTDTPPVLKSEIIAEKTERYTTRFWAEFFASIHIVVSFCVSFILQLFKFLLYSIIRPLVVGILQMGSDYFLKPFLTTFFNGVIQPVLIFYYNIATSVRDLCDPIAEAFGYFCREIAVVFRAIRLCTYKKNGNEESCGCDKNKKCEC